jgi:hypothetical protein
MILIQSDAARFSTLLVANATVDERPPIKLHLPEHVLDSGKDPDNDIFRASGLEIINMFGHHHDKLSWWPMQEPQLWINCACAHA